LQKLIEAVRCKQLLYAQHVEGCGKEFFEEICKRDLEGIVAKRKLSSYKDDGTGWLKIKNRTYSQAEGRNDIMFPSIHSALNQSGKEKAAN
jgi:ATP-dependent DNA ligase